MTCIVFVKIQIQKYHFVLYQFVSIVCSTYIYSIYTYNLEADITGSGETTPEVGVFILHLNCRFTQPHRKRVGNWMTKINIVFWSAFGTKYEPIPVCWKVCNHLKFSSIQHAATRPGCSSISIFEFEPEVLHNTSNKDQVTFNLQITSSWWQHWAGQTFRFCTSQECTLWRVTTAKDV